MMEKVRQIVIEQISNNGDGNRVLWLWNAFGEDEEIASGTFDTLIECVDEVRLWLG